MNGLEKPGIGELDLLLYRLDPVEREALTLLYRHGLTQGQIADKLGASRRTVKQLVMNGMRVVAVFVADATVPPPLLPALTVDHERGAAQVRADHRSL